MGLTSTLKWLFLACVALCCLTMVVYLYLSNQQTAIHVISLDYPDDVISRFTHHVTFTEFIGDLNITRPLPHPRSHVITNSSHVIALFARDTGCTREGKHGIHYQYLDILLVCQYEDTPGYYCRSWTWDPANWTLRLSDKLEPSAAYNGYLLCAYPVMTDRVHLVHYANGSVHMPGCSPGRNACTTVEPYFDKLLNMRMNWSPCCRAMTIKLLSDTVDVFEEQNIRYVMIGGACISVIRENGSFIPYDTDLDIMIHIKDRHQLKNGTVLALNQLGYYLTWHRRDTYVRFCINAICDAHIDAWFYEFLPNDRNRVRYHGMNWWEVRKAMIFPPSWQHFEGRKYRFPRKIVNYLDHEYSKGVMAGYRNWKDVFLCNYKIGRKCTHYAEYVKKKKKL